MKTPEYHVSAGLFGGIYGQVSKALCGKENATAEEIIAAFDQVKRERDALAALYKPHSACGECKHYESAVCDNCTSKNNCWEWRGVKED